MADTKPSAFTPITALDGPELLPVIESGPLNRVITVANLKAYVDQGVRNASVTTPGAGFASDTYLVGSSCAIPNGRLQAKTQYRVRFRVAKTAAGTAAPVITVRIGTAGAIGDTSRAALTFAAQTAAIDDGIFEIWCTFRTVGSGTSAVLEATGSLTHRQVANASTGLANVAQSSANNVGGGFDSTVSNLIIGISVNGGASAAWTITGVQADLLNLT
jgi:hypothetical protein